MAQSLRGGFPRVAWLRHSTDVRRRMVLRSRKMIYLALATIGSVVWIPLAFAGIALVIGAFGLLSIGALFRCIFALPVTSKFSRRYFSVAISPGIILMFGFVLLPAVSRETPASALLVLSGLVLVVVGFAVLVEMHTKHT